MSDVADRGITVTELAAMDQPIDVSRETSAAFVGRALRGPLNEPVLVKSFGEFRRRFGDVWSRSSLGPAVQQFFEHGGRHLYIVRVANNARGAMLCLPASGSALVLRAVEAGFTETIRAAVDYDGIDASNSELFNLTLQRIDPANGLIVDQELFHAASYREASPQYIVDLLLNSTLARVEAPLPTHRPEPTSGARLASLQQVAQISLPVSPPGAARELPELEFFFSFRSPYSYLALQRAFRIADAFGLAIRVRPVLPMVMRGLPVPKSKLRYIASDAVREAERLKIPFGRFADPMGAGVERCLAVYAYSRKEKRNAISCCVQLRLSGRRVWMSRRIQVCAKSRMPVGCSGPM
ncbi:MAG: hypothetical protein O2805_00695 [Proteobacteria bacterium]|nr:hypothetical protein [Pseudomonadota bacterium]